MGTDPLSFQVRVGDIDRVAGRVQEYFKANKQMDCPREVVQAALAEWFGLEAEHLWEQAAELLTTPRMNESREFQRILERKMAGAEAAYPETEFQPIFDLGEASVFNGHRCYSGSKLGAMIRYLRARVTTFTKRSSTNSCSTATLRFSILLAWVSLARFTATVRSARWPTPWRVY